MWAGKVGVLKHTWGPGTSRSLLWKAFVYTLGLFTPAHDTARSRQAAQLRGNQSSKRFTAPSGTQWSCIGFGPLDFFPGNKKNKSMGWGERGSDNNNITTRLSHDEMFICIMADKHLQNSDQNTHTLEGNLSGLAKSRQQPISFLLPTATPCVCASPRG